MGPIAEIQVIEMQAAAADDARRTSRAIHTDPTPGYLADVCRALADAEAFCRRAPFDHRNNPPVSNGHEGARFRDAAVRKNAENAP